MYTTYVLTFLGSITKYNCYSTYEHLIMLDVFYKIKTMAIGGNDLVIDNTFSRWIYKSAIFFAFDLCTFICFPKYNSFSCDLLLSQFQNEAGVF